VAGQEFAGYHQRMHIKPVDRTISQLLEAGFYKIPRFQRPYSWDKENVDDLWTDAIASDDPDYFIGSFVLYKEKEHSNTYMVVDGQQRLTTLTLLLAAVRNALDTLYESNLATGIQKLIEREDINNDRRYVLQTETSYPFLQEYIQKHGAAELPKSAGREEQALELAFEHLTSKVAGVLQAVDDDPGIAPARKNSTKQKKLLAIRNNALRLQLIVVELTNEDDAYLIFETLNTRGKDLGVADLVKNYLTRLLKPTNKAVDVAKEKWNSMLTLFDTSAAEIDVNAFIYHSWLSRYPYTGKERLFKDLKSRIANKAMAMTFLNDLVDDAELYRQLLEPEAHNWTKQEREIAASLTALNIFKVVQPVPMTLAIMRSYRAAGLNMSQTRAILHAMENFHVQFTAVTAQRTGGGTARMYAAAAEELTNAKDKNQRAKVLNRFKLKMRERIPSYQEFEANFAEIEYRSDNTKQKAVVQYLLRRVDTHLRGGSYMDYNVMSIEHIAPESPAPGAPSVQGIGKIGNLVLLAENINNKLGNADFKAKLAAYKKAGSPHDPVLNGAAFWTDAEINQRTINLARLGYDTVFRV
jgi:uncharacterized protein with ParB-like and HNH nuclease domain